MAQCKGGGENPKSVRWNNDVKSTVRRKEAAGEKALGAGDEEAKERCMEAYREQKRKVKKRIYLNNRM